MPWLFFSCIGHPLIILYVCHLLHEACLKIAMHVESKVHTTETRLLWYQTHPLTQAMGIPNPELFHPLNHLQIDIVLNPSPCAPYLWGARQEHSVQTTLREANSDATSALGGERVPAARPSAASPGCLRSRPRRLAPPPAPATRAVPKGGPGPGVATPAPQPAFSPGPPRRPRARVPRET